MTVLCVLHGGPADGNEMSYDAPPTFITVHVRGKLALRQARYQRAGGTCELTHYECVEENY